MNDAARAQVLGWKQTVEAVYQQAAAGPAVTRGLTPEEMAIAREVFGNSLDLSQVQLTDGSFLGRLKDDNAITIPGQVNFPPGTLANPPAQYKSWLIHELTHAWQYQHGYQIDDLLPSAMAGVYDYGGEPGLRDATAQGKQFTSFNFEQQGDILRDYYTRRSHGMDTSAYDPFVREVQADGPELDKPLIPGPII